MAGLLDFLDTDEGRLGLGLLAAAGPRADGMGAGGRIQEAFAGADARKKAQAQAEWQKMQMEDARSQIEARKLAGIKDARQQAMIEALMGGGSPGQGGMTDQGGTSRSPGIIDLARQLGIPEKAIQSDMAFNGGKGIAAMLEKRGSPDMQVTNGYAYDKNRLGAGFMPSLSTSQDGKTGMVQIGPDGLPVVSAPRGAMETYGGYQDAQAARKPIKVFNPETQREEFSNEGAVTANQRPQGYAMPNIGDGQPTPQQMALIRADIARTGNPNPTLNFSAQPGGQQTAMGGGNFAAGPSADEAARNDANKARVLGMVSVDKSRLDALEKEAQTQNGIIQTLDSIEPLIKQGTLGNRPTDQLKRLGQKTGLYQTQEAINANNIEKLGNQLVLARGSLGSGVSVADAERYDKAAGNFTKAQSVQEQLQYIGIMRDIAQNSFNSTNRVRKEYEQTGSMPSYGANAEKIGGGASGSWDAPARPETQIKRATISDIAATARASGKTTEEVTRAMRAAGYQIGGQ
jgi:hypothetical protein